MEELLTEERKVLKEAQSEVGILRASKDMLGNEVASLTQRQQRAQQDVARLAEEKAKIAQESKSQIDTLTRDLSHSKEVLSQVMANAGDDSEG
jgi:hypothetical protein